MKNETIFDRKLDISYLQLTKSDDLDRLHCEGLETRYERLGIKKKTFEKKNLIKNRVQI